MLDRSTSPKSPPARTTPAPGFVRRLLVSGAALLAVAASASAAVTDLSGNLTQVLDTAIGAGNSGRLTANTKTIWNGTTAASNVDLNNFEFTINNGGGNAQTYNGALTGPGTLRLEGRGGADWDPDIQLAGTAANSPTGVTLTGGRATLNKTDGVDALAGPITVNTTATVRIVLKKSNQISDASTITSTASSGTFHLDMPAFNETISTLTIKTGHYVNTGIGGVLKVTTLTVGGIIQPKGAYTASCGFVTGTGYIDVDNFGPPVILSAPGTPTSPVPAIADSTVNPAYLSKLTWTAATDATSYDVYFWLAAETKPATANATVFLPEFAVSPQVLSLENYKWEVVAKNSIGNTEGPVWTFSTIDRKLISGNLTNTLDATVGAGPAQLTANATSYYGSGTFAASINLNGFQFTHNSGGGNQQTYNGAITGPGTLRIQGRDDASWAWPDPQLGGTVANSMSAVIVECGHLELNKTAGVDALAGAITASPAAANTARIHLSKSNQISDTSTITSAAAAGSFYLEMNGFSDTILGLDIKTGHQVQTGTGGVLTVTNLTVGGVIQGPGTYTSSSAFVTGTGSVVVPGATTPADTGLSTVTASPASVVADGITTSTITVTLLDATSTVVPGKTVTLASSRTVGIDTISPAAGVSNASGVVTFTVKSSTPDDAIFTATDTTDSVTVSQTATVTFTAIPPASADSSTVAASPTSLRADGVHTSTITVTLLNGSSAAVAGKTVTLASDRGAIDTISGASGVSNASGVVTFTVKSTTPGSPVFTATDVTDSNLTITQTATVTFTSNPAAGAGTSTVEASPSSLVANGTSQSTITVTLKESGGSGVAGKTVTLASSRSAGTDTISAAAGVSDAAGVVTFTVTSLTAGAPVFTATDTTDGVTVSATATVTFTAATNVVDISNVLFPWEPANTAAGVKIDTAVPSGYSGRLVGTTQTHWASGGFSRALDLNANTLIIDSGNGNTMTVSGALSGNGTLIFQAGGGNPMHVSGSSGNTYTGTTTISNAIVSLEKSSGDALQGPITLNNAASRLNWTRSNQINDASNLTLASGSSLNFAGYAETMGTLAVTGDANIYLGSGSSIVHFADSSAVTWTSGKQLIIREWNGSPTGGGTESVFFGSTVGGLIADQVLHIGFMNPAGFATGLYHAAILATGEVVPTGTAVIPVSPPYDLSPEAAAARTAIYTSTGRADLTKAGTPLTTGTRIVFFGDSITWQNTYISKLNTAIAAGAGTQGKTITLVNRGINGGGVADIRDGAAGSGYPGNTAQASFASLLTSDQANIAVVYIGINDAGWRNTTAAAYEQGLRDLAATAATQHVKLVFATPAANGESPVGAGGIDPKIDQFSTIVQTVASSTGASFVNLREAFVNYWKNNNYEIRLDGSFVTLVPFGLLTYDGIHPTDLGNQMIADQLAEGILASYTGGNVATATTVTASGVASTVGASVTLTATVLPKPSGGTVQFHDNGTDIGAAATVNTGTGVATLATTDLTVGNHAITATYSGITGFATSADATGANQTVLSKFAGWALDKGLSPGVNDGPNDDPDADAVKNFIEFALNGDPKSAADNGMIHATTETSTQYNNNKVLVLTIAVRPGTPSTWNNNTATVDGITYTIQGGTALNDFSSDGSKVSAADTNNYGAGPPTNGYEWRRFILTSSETLGAKGFLRAMVEQD